MMKFFGRRLLLIAVLVISLSGCNSRGGTTPRVRLERVAEGFTSPVVLYLKRINFLVFVKENHG
jgi:hypothetical protein